KLPYHLVFGFACLIRFYKGSWNGKTLPVKDSPEIIAAFDSAWINTRLEGTVSEILENTEFWGEDLNQISGLSAAIVYAIENAEENGIENGYQKFIRDFS